MDIRWINNLPGDPDEFLHFRKKHLKIPLNKAFKLYFITLKIEALSDSPIYKFLERVPLHVKFDEIEKRKFLMTLSVFSLRQLIEEHLDLRLVKNLYLFLSKKLPKEFFKDCAPKHSILSSQDIIIDILSEEEKLRLPAYLKVKHLFLTFSLSGTCEEIINILPLLELYTLIKSSQEYKVFTSLSISEYLIFATKVKRKEKLKELREKIDIIIENLKIYFPDCFGEI